MFANGSNSLIDEVLKFMERRFYMVKTADKAPYEQNGAAVKPKDE